MTDKLATTGKTQRTVKFKSRIHSDMSVIASKSKSRNVTTSSITDRPTPTTSKPNFSHNALLWNAIDEIRNFSMDATTLATETTEKLSSVQLSSEKLNQQLRLLKNEHTGTMSEIRSDIMSLKTTMNSFLTELRNTKLPPLNDVDKDGSIISEEEEAGTRETRKENGAHIQPLGNYSTGEKLQIWQILMEGKKINGIDDPLFSTVRNLFKRLQQNYPLPTDLEKEMIFFAFGPNVLAVVNRVYSENLNCSCEEIWNKLATRLHSERHVQNKKQEFMSTAWKQGSESIQNYAERVMTLGEVIEAEEFMVRVAFTNGLPKRLKTFAYGSNGTFCELVSRIAAIAEADELSNVEDISNVNV